MSSIFILTTLFGGLVIAYLAAKIFKRQTDDVVKLLKPPGAHWLWGHEREAWETPDSAWYIRNMEKNGLVLAMKGALFHPDLVAVADPAALHHIFGHSHRFIKNTAQRPWVDRFFGRGILWAEGTEHTRQRQSVAPLFTAARVKNMDEDVQAATSTFIDKFRQYVLSDPTSPNKGVRVDVLSWLAWPTLDIIGRLTLGYDFHCGESKEARGIHKAWKEIVGLSMTFLGFVGPLILRTFPWISDLPLTIIQKDGTVKTIVKDLARNILSEMEQAGEDVSSRNDVLGALIKKIDASDSVGADMALDQICTIIFAGHETTTTALSMTLLELARRKDFQTMLRKEIVEFSSTGPGGQLSYDDVTGTSLLLLDAICKEGLRMSPVGSHMERVATQDDLIPLRFPLVTNTGETLTTIRIQKGQVFYIPALAVNLNTEMWGADGHKFEPSRWMEPGRLPSSSSLTSGINGHFSFIEGPRLCVGYRLAIFEFKVILSALIKNFEFETTEECIQTMWATTLQPFVRKQKKAGPQLPLLVKRINS